MNSRRAPCSLPALAGSWSARACAPISRCRHRSSTGPGGLMLPGKKYKPEDYVQIAWARRWLLIVPFLLVIAGGITYAMMQPNRYKAQTSIMVTPQQVPKDYVES